jgi:hypothetical protein
MVEAIPDAESLLSLADTAPLPRHSMPFERPVARPILAPEMLPRRAPRLRRFVGGAIVVLAAVGIAAVAWLAHHH